MRKQEELTLNESRSRSKKTNLQTRKLILREELKVIERREKALAINRKRYYLHRMCRINGLVVKAGKRSVYVTEDLSKKQLYYCNQLNKLGYNIQQIIK